MSYQKRKDSESSISRVFSFCLTCGVGLLVLGRMLSNHFTSHPKTDPTPQPQEFRDIHVLFVYSSGLEQSYIDQAHDDLLKHLPDRVRILVTESFFEEDDLDECLEMRPEEIVIVYRHHESKYLEALVSKFMQMRGYNPKVRISSEKTRAGEGKHCAASDRQEDRPSLLKEICDNRSQRNLVN